MAAIGDIIGGIADIESGHPLQALSHLTDALKDLPQLAQGLSGAQAKDAATPAGTAGAEPSAPPSRANQSSSIDLTPSTSAPTPQAPKVDVQTRGKELIVSIDDGTHTTVIVDKPGQKPVVTVHLDKAPGASAPGPGTPAPTPPPAGTTPGATATPGTSAPGATTPGATTPGATTPGATTPGATTPGATTPGTTTPGATPATTPSTAPGPSAPAANTAAPAPTPQNPKVTVRRIGRETITSVDDGKRTTVIVHRPGHRPIVRTHADRPTSPVIAGGTTGTASATTAPSTTSGTKATTSAAADTSSTPAADSSKTTSTSSAAADGAAESSSSSADGTSAPASGSSASSSGSSVATPADLKSLLAMSPDQFLQAVTSGKIPDSVANSQSAMMAVQARMNQITQMNQLVTGMMAAMHQMEMSIIQNIRC
jgi:hypothetical protein